MPIDLLPDLCDEFEDNVRVIELPFQHFGEKTEFSGKVVTVKCFEDNSVVKQLVNTPGNNQVMVVDGGASMRRALLGDMLAEAAVKNGWAGLVISGCIRDVATINTLNLGVKALGTNPMKTEKKGVGEKHVPITLAGVEISHGDWLYADLNGVIISPVELSTE
ncbi:putative 4-hydroxy-4-methyl-2-oxoglutarate aldolase [Thalassotalea euphylliae]|uniref:putative 4-hydroxy-4-methyl-2-oxoglutarate aldolase n=1 Tax=Thalassotalea euphylliae TaxID=1655234 RepID=UPI0036353865